MGIFPRAAMRIIDLKPRSMAPWASPSIASALGWLALAMAWTGYLTVFPAAPMGLYLPDPGSPPFRWMSNRVIIPLNPRTGSTHLSLQLRAPPQADGTPLAVTFAT